MSTVPEISAQSELPTVQVPASVPLAPTALISLKGLERAFSKERLAGYRLSSDIDPTDGLARYLWNQALGRAITPALHALEVTLRNDIVQAANKIVPSRIAVENVAAAAVGGPVAFVPGTFPSWLDVSPTMLYQHEKKKLDRAKSELGSHHGSHTEGHLIAKLDFGFWVALCRKSYDASRADGPRLWPAGLAHAFKARPASVSKIQQIHDRLDSIRQFRNRVAHHDPIWDRDYLMEHDRIIDTLAWMSPKLATTVQALSCAPDVYATGASAYRPLAEDILGTGPGRSADPVRRVVTALRAVPEATRAVAASKMLASLQIPEE